MNSYININTLPKQTIINLINMLEPANLKDIVFTNDNLLKEYRDDIYMKCLSNNILLKNDKYLYETVYSNLPETFSKILELTKENPHICIANQFPHNIYFNKTIFNFIEIYVLNKSDEIPIIIKGLIELLMKIYEQFGEYETYKISNKEYLLKYSLLEIKFIFEDFESLCQVLMSLNNSYMRCGFYTDKMYIAPDTKMISGYNYNHNIDIMIIDYSLDKCDDLILLLAKNKIIFS